LKLGILADIHEAVPLLERALARFEAERIDRVVILGDLFETGARIEAIASLLSDSGAVGVYGNHDHGLCVDPGPEVRAEFSPGLLRFMGSLRPRLEIGGALFAHREPWLDGARVDQIWHVDEDPLTPELVARSFDAVPHRWIFVGHFHRWLATTRSGPLPWDGRSPLVLGGPEPALVVVNAVCEGYAATFETGAGRLQPLDLYEPGERPPSRPVPLLPGPPPTRPA